MNVKTKLKKPQRKHFFKQIRDYNDHLNILLIFRIICYIIFLQKIFSFFHTKIIDTQFIIFCKHWIQVSTVEHFAHQQLSVERFVFPNAVFTFPILGAEVFIKLHVTEAAPRFLQHLSLANFVALLAYAHATARAVSVF